MTKLWSATEKQETYLGGRGEDKHDHTHSGVTVYMVLHTHHNYHQPIGEEKEPITLITTLSGYCKLVIQT